MKGKQKRQVREGPAVGSLLAEEAGSVKATHTLLSRYCSSVHVPKTIAEGDSQKPEVDRFILGLHSPVQSRTISSFADDGLIWEDSIGVSLDRLRSSYHQPWNTIRLLLSESTNSEREEKSHDETGEIQVL